MKPTHYKPNMTKHPQLRLRVYIGTVIPDTKRLHRYETPFAVLSLVHVHAALAGTFYQVVRNIFYNTACYVLLCPISTTGNSCWGLPSRDTAAWRLDIGMMLRTHDNTLAMFLFVNALCIF